MPIYTYFMPFTEKRKMQNIFLDPTKPCSIECFHSQKALAYSAVKSVTRKDQLVLESFQPSLTFASKARSQLNLPRKNLIIYKKL